MEPQSNGFVNNFGTFSVGENSIGQDQGFGKNIGDKIRNEVDNAITVVEIMVVEIMVVEITWRDFGSDGQCNNTASWNGVKSIIESSGRGAGSMVQNPDQINF